MQPYQDILENIFGFMRIHTKPGKASADQRSQSLGNIGKQALIRPGVSSTLGTHGARP
jgi:hypothetical protein